MKLAICPGSFDPVTLGHLDIITRASKLFDKVIVVVMTNASKSPLFTHVERMDLLQRVIEDAGIENVTVDCYDGLLADYAKMRNATAIVKGLRAVSDFEYEFQMALTNRKLYPEAETVFLTTSAENLYLSSSLVKQVARFGGEISDFVPSCILPQITEKLRKEREV
ncbi:MAG: pantetheine-phosphate adenylyltransferase [Ruminococcaceae bacterium]|nr:pantetheine-phosphate adenylyltransferase [Oscillospiraceae bacterium]